MNLQSSAIRACEVVGSQADLARLIEVSPAAVHQWCKGMRPIPAERCVDIERVTGRQVMRWGLRPDDWYRIWPELIGTEGAPPVAEHAKAEG